MKANPLINEQTKIQESKAPFTIDKFKKILKEYNAFINLIAFLFAITAMFLSYKQLQDSIIQTQELKKLYTHVDNQHQDVKHIKEEIKKRPTEKINAFPGNLSTIIEKILDQNDMPKNEILICTDVLAYGYLSNYEAFVEYETKLLTTLLNKSKDVNFELLVYEDEALRNTIDKQFSHKKDSISNVLRNTSYYKYHENRNKDLVKQLDKIKGYNQFKNLLFNQNMKILKKLQSFSPENNPLILTRVPEDFPFFMWIIDDRKAVISFPNYQKNSEQAFYTTDKELIKIFKGVFKQLKKTKYWK